MQPVSMLMSNLNVEANTHHAPNALAVAQDTGQSQEIIRDGIRIVQTVQASEEAHEAQRVHRKNENDEREQKGGGGERDTFEKTAKKTPASEQHAAPLIKEKGASKKSFEFLA